MPRFSQTAVARNTVKRRLRELARTELLPTMSALDVTIRALPGTYGATFDALKEEVRRVGERLQQTKAVDGTERQ